MNKKYFYDENSVLYKIKSIHANEIYNSKKLYEFRKIIPLKKPKVVFLYEHEDCKAITGAFIINDIISLPPLKLAQKAKLSGNKLKSLLIYFKGYKIGNAFQIGEVFKFDEPLTNREIKDLYKQYKSPQSFIYLKTYKKLEDKLFTMLDDEYKKRLSLISFSVPNDKDFKIFKKIALEEVSKNYDEIDSSFVDHIIGCTKMGKDGNGYFTKRKDLVVLKKDNLKIGYTVLTQKIGDSIKTGPTILFNNFRKLGYGQLVRKKIEYDYYNMGFRKVYCTCNALDKNVLYYLMNSGMRIEAHLINQYKNNSSEIVLGKLLVKEKKFFPKIKRVDSEITKIKIVSGKISGLMRSFFKKNFELFYCKIDDSFLDILEKASKRFSLMNYHEKEKKIYSFEDNVGKIIGSVICSLKRGGAVKLTLLIKTQNYQSIKRAIKKVELDNKKHYRKKIYLNLPVNDIIMIGYFSKMNYQIEGLLQAPYLPGLDLVQMGKLI